MNPPGPFPAAMPAVSATSASPAAFGRSSAFVFPASSSLAAPSASNGTSVPHPMSASTAKSAPSVPSSPTPTVATRDANEAGARGA